jgi:hypothetical protein
MLNVAILTGRRGKGMKRSSGYLTLGEVARRYGVPVWRVRRLYERELLPQAPRAATWRLVAVRDLPKVRKALQAAGYLPPVEVPTT